MSLPNGQPEPRPEPVPEPEPPEPGPGPTPVPTSVRATILSALEDGKSAALQTGITQDAICKAERIMRQINERWPSNSIPGKS